jgi:hypothetical protein
MTLENGLTGTLLLGGVKSPVGLCDHIVKKTAKKERKNLSNFFSFFSKNFI